MKKALSAISNFITKGTVSVKWFYRRFAEAFAAVAFGLFIFWVVRPFILFLDPESGLMALDRLERPVFPGLLVMLFFLGFYTFLLFSMPELLKYLYPEEKEGENKTDQNSFTNDFLLLKPWQRLFLILVVFLSLLLCFVVFHWVLNK